MSKNINSTIFTPVLIAGSLILLISFAIRSTFGLFQIPIAEQFMWARGYVDGRKNMSLFSKFKNNLQKTSNFLSSNILTSFQNKKVDRETLEELEAILISADISLDVVEKLINSVRKVKTSDQDITKTVLETLSKEIEIILQPREGGSLEENNNNKQILIFVGVNGSPIDFILFIIFCD